MAILKMNQLAQYDSIAKAYTSLAKKDPVKQFVQFPESLRLLGDVRDKRVLDIGCGAGLLTEQIAGRGAAIVAYDISEKQIALALENTQRNPTITYLVSCPEKIVQDLESAGISGNFDAAVSTLVLFYAKNTSQLADFFKSTHFLLKQGAQFVSIVLNPAYEYIGIAKFSRIFARKNCESRVDFLDSDKNIIASAAFSDFSKSDYELAAKEAGFEKFEWACLRPSIEGIMAMGRDYWMDFSKSPPYVGFVATKD